MGWYISPSPKGKTQPIMCERGACEHKDCAANWKLIDSPCAGCGEPIGEQNEFYFLDGGKHAHLRCSWDDKDNWKF